MCSGRVLDVIKSAMSIIIEPEIWPIDVGTHMLGIVFVCRAVDIICVHCHGV